MAEDIAIYVAFPLCRFAFHALTALHKAYMRANNGPCRNDPAKASRVISTAWRRVMTFFARLFGPRTRNITTTLERQRLARTMPGQTGALAANRLGMLVH